MDLLANVLSQFFFDANRYSGHVTIEQDGELYVDLGNSDSWKVSNRMTLSGGRVLGDALTVTGILEGYGNVSTTLTNSGHIDPGLEIGTLSVSGTYDQTANGTLHIDITGTNPLTQFDRVSIFGNTLLDGTVEIEFAEGFIPSAGNSFEFLSSFLPRVGTFADLDVLAPLGIMIDGQLQYTSNTVSYFVNDAFLGGDFDNDGSWGCADVDSLVSLIANGETDDAFDLNHDEVIDANDLEAWLTIAGGLNLPNGSSYLFGDANLDGVVDGGDFLIWNANKFTPTTGWCSGNFNADDTVDGADFLVWNTNKFQSSDSLSTVPEATSWLWVLMAIATISRSMAPFRA